MNPPMSRKIGLPRAGRERRQEEHDERDADRPQPAQISRNSDGLRWRSARAMSRARFAPKSRCSTTRLRLLSASLEAIRSGHAALAARRRPSLRSEGFAA